MLLLFFMGSNTFAHAWSGSGHRFIGSLAWSQMTPGAKKMVKELLASGDDAPGTTCKADSISTASSWLDCARGNNVLPFSEIFHADRYPVCVGMVIPSKCKTGHCTTDSLKEAIHNLENPISSVENRRTSLKIILHLVEDLHQPLHVATNGDMNGNETMVLTDEQSKPISLHQYWDRNLISAIRQHENDVYELMKSRASSMRVGTVDDWNNQTTQEARTMVYGELLGDKMCLPRKQDAPPILLTTSYQKHAYALMQLKMAEAGVRLAYILNHAAQLQSPDKNRQTHAGKNGQLPQSGHKVKRVL